MPRYFTLDEARAALPAASARLREAVQAKARYDEAEKAFAELLQRVMLRGGLVVNTALAGSWKSQKDSSSEALRTALGGLEEMGVLVKDLDTGLLDFPALHKGREVYLCWKAGEDDISHWHGVQEGFAGRKPIDEEFLGHLG